MFDLVLGDIEGVFASEAFVACGIPAFPENYQGKKLKEDEYVTMQVLPTSSSNNAYGGDKKKLTGLVAVKIFVAAGNGQGRIMVVGDCLDTIMQNQTLTAGTQLGTSYINMEGLDSSNAALYSASYFIPFTSYGE